MERAWAIKRAPSRRPRVEDSESRIVGVRCPVFVQKHAARMLRACGLGSHKDPRRAGKGMRGQKSAKPKAKGGGVGK